MQYPNSIPALEDQLNQAPDSDITDLAARIIAGAKAFDLKKAENLGVNFKLNGIKRNTYRPNFTEHDVVKGAPWADNPNNPLEKGEKWNEGRRATATAMTYTFNAAGHPINPYMNTGLEGRGVLGQYGPNHAVDNGILVIKEDENGTPTLYALGITRKFDNDAPAFAGGFAKYARDDEGAYIFDNDAVIETKVEEFFEEMVSGSIELLPEYAALYDDELKNEVQSRLAKQNDRSTELAADIMEELEMQTTTHLKMKQVQDKDPEFFTRLRSVIADSHDCFAGPVLNDNRSTNNAWIETRLSWFLMDDDTWEYIKGDNPQFHYELSAGDDASDVILHRLDADLIEKGFASHGPMFAFMAVSFLLDAQNDAVHLDSNIISQMNDIADYLKQYIVIEPDLNIPQI